jgi:hypothetical protein
VSDVGARHLVAWPGLGLAALAAVTALARPAAAADEDEWRLSGRAGIASVQVDGRNPFGMTAGLGGEYGLSDAWSVHMTGNLSRHTVSANEEAGLPGGAVYTGKLLAGATYALDVLRLVPYFDVGLGLFSVSGAVKTPRRIVGMQAGIGAEYLLGPRWAVGAVAEYIFSPFDLIATALSGGGVPQAFALTARVSWVLR